MLFEVKIGFSVVGVRDYYLGNSDKFIAAKSADALLKITLPHIFSFGLFIMVLLHFLIFTKERYKAKSRFLVYLTFIATFIEISSPFLIIYGSEFFAYGKILGFIIFNSLILYSTWLLLSSIMND